VSGFFFRSSSAPHHTAPIDPNVPPPPKNGNILVPCTIIKVVVFSAAESELGAFFFNSKEAAALRTTMNDMGHPHPATPIQTENLCASGIANDTVKQRRSKAVDMRFYWILDRVQQNQFVVHWRRGIDNLADYFTKHHSPVRHRLMSRRYLLDLHLPLPMVRSGEGVFNPPGSTNTTNETNNIFQDSNQPSTSTSTFSASKLWPETRSP
jgi:hypothetical protein